MMHKRTLIIGACAVALIVVGVVVFWRGQPNTKTVLAGISPVLGEMALGDDDAPVTIVEYASLSCSHCASFHLSILPKIKEEFIDTGKLRILVRDFPLNPSALYAAMLAHCAGDDRYFSFVDILFKRQMTWAISPNIREALAEIARLGGIGSAAFDACMENDELRDQILAVRLHGEKEYRISATPSFIIGGKIFTGVIPYEQMKSLINAELDG